MKREESGRGGSISLIENVKPGDDLIVAPPVNDFELARNAQAFLFIAGGIGITPILPMIDRLAALGKPFALHYGVRERRTAPFCARLAGHGDKVRTAFSREPGGQRRLDIAGVVARTPDDCELYCCGPAAMLEAFAAATADRDPARVHVEHFFATEPPAVEGGFRVTLARSGRTIAVPTGRTILDALTAAGIEVPCSCLEGVCGTCETRVIDGIPDHRDRVLSPQERAANTTMMLCCSGSKSEQLVLDI